MGGRPTWFWWVWRNTVKGAAFVTGAEAVHVMWVMAMDGVLSKMV